MQAFKRVNEISNLARGSKAWCRVKSSLAAPVVKRTGKRLPIGERRVMVESFVNRYRGENSGKFPTASHAMKEVGGSYYIVKKIMQELEYNFKLRSSNSVKEVSSGTEMKSSYLSAGSKSDADEYKPSPEISIPVKPEDVKEEENYEFLLDIDGSKSKSEFHQPLSEVSCSENHKDVAEQLTCGSVLEVDGSESKIDKYQPSPDYLLAKKADEIKEEERNQCIQQPLPEVLSAKKSEDAKEETCSESVLDVNNTESKNELHQPSHEYSVPKIPKNIKEEKPNQDVVESVLDVGNSESKNEEHQPSHEYSVPKIPENIKEKKPNQDVVNIDGSESIAEEHQKSAWELSEKKTSEKVQIKPSIWGTLRSVAEDFINIWKKR